MRVASIYALIVGAAAVVPAFSSMPEHAASGQARQPGTDEAFLDEQFLLKANIGVDGPALLKYFKDATPTEVEYERLVKLVKQLGDEKFTVRDKAHGELLAMGTSALGILKEAAHDADQEVRLRATELCNSIKKQPNPLEQAAVARLIALRRPEGAAGVLLAYLPCAVDDSVVDELCNALAQVAVRDGKAEPAVVAALKGNFSVQRGAAAAALVAAGAKEHVAAAQALLKDSNPAVRLRVAHAFVRYAFDKKAMQVLIDCLQHLPYDRAWLAEELLLRVAGEQAPEISQGRDQQARKKNRDLWTKWWQNNQKDIDLAKIDFSNAILGYTLLVCQNQPAAAGGKLLAGSTVLELNAAKQTRWQFQVPSYCNDAQVIGANRVLLVERNDRCVTERDFNGTVLWQQTLPAGTIMSAQRLRNGNTFVVMQNRLVEYDRNNKEVYSFTPPKLTTYRGRKLASGNIVYIASTGAMTWLDSTTNREIRTAKLVSLGNAYGTLEELPNGNLLLPLYTKKCVVEIDQTGREVWSLNVNNYAYSATRLPNGNTLVVTVANVKNLNKQIVEYDRNQREVWSHQVEGTVLVARKR